MTPETFVVVVVLLVVKYTLDLADRTGAPRRWRRGRRQGAAVTKVVNVAVPECADGAAEQPNDDPFWEMVTARIHAVQRETHREAGTGR